MKTCIGVDLGGTTIKMGLFDGEGNLLEKWEIPTRVGENGRWILEDIAAEVRKTAAGREEEFLGVGIGVPGPVLDDGYVCVCVNLDWRDGNPVRDLRQMLGVPVFASNDANVAALGEQWRGSGRGYESAGAVTLGTGLGCGVILNGRIVNGSKGMGGELGHITVNRFETERCSCGNCGCLEQYASANGIVRLAKRFLAATDEPSLLRDMPEITAKDVTDAAKHGDAVADRAVTESMEWLAVGLSCLSHVADPEILIIGGGVSKAGEFLLDKVRGPYERYISQSNEKTPIVLASLGNDAGIYGAARLVLQQAE